VVDTSAKVVRSLLYGDLGMRLQESTATALSAPIVEGVPAIVTEVLCVIHAIKLGVCRLTLYALFHRVLNLLWVYDNLGCDLVNKLYALKVVNSVAMGKTGGGIF
jgi:hypothetical protein